MPHVEGAGVALHYEERGDGSPLLVIHAMASAAAAWSAALDELAAAGARAIAYDRRGYGASGAPQPYTATTVQEQARDAEKLLEALDATPALLVGEGFGALVALELIVRRPRLATGAVVLDPPLYAYVPAATQALAAERQALEQALRDRGPAAAVEAWLRERGGRRADEQLAGKPEGGRPQAGAQAGFFADYGGLASWSPSRRELRAIAVPVAVLTGANAPAHTVAAADAAAALLSDARRRGDADVIAAVSSLLHPM